MASPAVTTVEFIARWNAHADRGDSSVRKLADELGVHERNVQQRRARIEESEGIILRSISSAERPRVDQSDLEAPELTRDQCIEKLLGVHAKYPHKWITSRQFAIETRLKDTVWSKFFGTFEEFNRQAGHGKTRQQSQFGKQIAKHVSVDRYREYGEQRLQYAENYLRDTTGRFKTILVASDIHDVDADPFYLRTLIDTARRVQPDIICLNGDIFDLPEFSKYTVDPRTWDVVGRIQFVHTEILGALRTAAPNAQIDLLEGNHEFRLVRHMADANPAMMALLSELHGMNVAKMFGLDRYEVNYIAKSDLSAYRQSDIKQEIARNFKIYYDCALAHHFPEGRAKGMPGWNGHHHKHQVWPNESPQFGPFEWHQLGAGHRRNAGYCDGERWHNGFMLAHVDTHTKATQFEYIQMHDFAVVGGLRYTRLPSEAWNAGQLEKAA